MPMPLTHGCPACASGPSAKLGYTDQEKSQLRSRGTPAEFMNGNSDIG
jgi:hypothetical protein